MKRQIDWEKLRIFHTVVRFKNFTKASKELGMTQPSTSRTIKALEDSLGVTLFKRHSRGLILTDEGQILYEATQNIAAQVNRACSLVVENKQNPQGTISVVTTLTFGSVWLAPRIEKFKQLYPDVDVNIIAVDNDFQKHMLNADCAILFGNSTDQTYLQRHLFVDQRFICGTKEYLKKHSVPTVPKDLDDHNLVVYSEQSGTQFMPTINWLLTIGVAKGKERRKPSLIVNSAYGVVNAVRSGLGIGIVPSYITYVDDQYVPVLTDYELVSPEVNFLFPRELRHSKKIEAFKDFLIQETQVIRDYNENQKKALK